MNQPGFLLQRLRRTPYSILAVCAIMLLSLMSSAAKAEPVMGNQIKPILIHNSYVLFPGKLAPYTKSGKLMVPIRPFSMALGAQMTYNVPAKSISVSLLGQTVNHIRAGQISAETGEGRAISLEVAPELREGVLFVPISPVLGALKSVRWENMGNNINRYTLSIQGRMGVTLPQTGPWLSVTPFTGVSGENYNPFYPVVLTQDSSGKGYRLNLSVINTSGFDIPKASSELVLVAVDSQGQAIVRRVPGPSVQTPKAAALSVTADIPSAAQYVIYNSRTVSKGQ
ncbi:hypothetical protein A3844_23830 [Paenibacillus helianthi]|uniref:Copper amine oxidase-like N-terminal domain-containing protein n=1 Tax=Paenibacillus helianthi TaxID=1349432 RepID=A0ABX3EJT7_9BACL|nr:copper amine oxidase N-terminal domain-containing protein [Paenibacillus helianthi]OKP82723.1 hypothetical protein A3844_23830 [Paenibacillus helianthi]